MRFWDFAIGGIGMIPGAFIYVFIGTTIGSISDAVRGEFDHGPLFLVFLIFGTISALLACTYMTMLIRRYLKKNLELNDEKSSQ